MPIGVKIWDAGSKVVVDYTSKVWNVYGSFYTNGAGGSVSNPLITANTTFVIAASDIQTRSANTGYTIDSPSITVAAGKISWSIPTTGRYYARWYVLYGE